MKTLPIFLAILLAVSSLSVANAQSKEELTKETIKIWGNCGMCQSRIEKAAKDAGATTAIWSDETKVLTVSFLSSKTSLTAIEEKIALAGHDTQNVKAGSDAYSKLPGCCKYERKP
jgi:mercuric ion binding protein